MHGKLYFIRKIKALFIKFRLHKLFKIFDGLLLNLIYLARLSDWIRKLHKIGFNDFYNSKVKYEDRFKLHDYVFANEKLSGEITYIEFGVARGVSFKWWVDKNKNNKSQFFGFDTFTGLPEDFGVMKKPHYDTKGAFPEVDDSRCKFYDGMFQDTLPGFIRENNLISRKVIHMDADLYSSTLYVLTMLHPFLKEGDILIFDEFGVPTHEFRAFTDFVHTYQFKYEVLGAINNYLQLAIKVIK
ncbi:MAG: TylF/MycF/NovP-related O-methyltransferase [bacterium]